MSGLPQPRAPFLQEPRHGIGVPHGNVAFERRKVARPILRVARSTWHLQAPPRCVPGTRPRKARRRMARARLRFRRRFSSRRDRCRPSRCRSSGRSRIRVSFRPAVLVIPGPPMLKARSSSRHARRSSDVVFRKDCHVRLQVRFPAYTFRARLHPPDLRRSRAGRVVLEGDRDRLYRLRRHGQKPARRVADPDHDAALDAEDRPSTDRAHGRRHVDDRRPVLQGRGAQAAYSRRHRGKSRRHPPQLLQLPRLSAMARATR